MRKLFRITMNFSSLDEQIDKFRVLALAYKKANMDLNGDGLSGTVAEE
jgi:hypothetical protein